jgi:putative endonuclease
METERTVYILRSDSDSGRHYVGVTANPTERLRAHNAGDSPHTAKHRPWHVLVSIQFSDSKAALAFETYLKSGSGRAFAKRHFV